MSADSAARAASRPLGACHLERAGAQWQIGGLFPATAIADDGALAFRRAEARWALADVRASGDCVIETSVTFPLGARFGVLFRASLDDAERMTGYSFDIVPTSGRGGYLVRLWESGRLRKRPLAHAPVTDPAQLSGAHVVRVALQGDELTVGVDGSVVLAMAGLSRAAVNAGREPCHGDRVGIQASSMSEVTVQSFTVAHQ